MKRSTLTAALLISLISLISGFHASAQKEKPRGESRTATQTKSTTDSKQPTAVSKVDKQIKDVDSTISWAKTTFTKTQETAEDIFKVFKSKPNEGAVMIHGIEYDDANLQSLFEVIKDRKEVKKATLEYAGSTATIKMSLKAKSEADFWNELPKELKDVFKMRSKKENDILVEYKAGNGNKAQLAQN